MKKNHRKNIFKYLWILGKSRIAIPVTLSALTGYILKKGIPDPGFLFTLAGVFLLACGAMALNQVQERVPDALMERTSGRPLPSGRLSVSQALMLTLVLIMGGSLILFFAFSFSAGPLLFGWLTLFWYNGVYTPLKKKSAFAVLPGSIVGGIPPVIGWLAAGGSLTDHRIVLLSFFFIIGQVPHFWLLTLMHGRQYESAGFPTLHRVFNELQIRRLTFVWIFWSAVVSLFLAFFGVMQHSGVMLVLLLGVIITLLFFLPLFTSTSSDFCYKKGFIRLNSFYFLVMMLLWLDIFLK